MWPGWRCCATDKTAIQGQRQDRYALVPGQRPQRLRCRQGRSVMPAATGGKPWNQKTSEPGRNGACFEAGTPDRKNWTTVQGYTGCDLMQQEIGACCAVTAAITKQKGPDPVWNRVRPGVFGHPESQAASFQNARSPSQCLRRMPVPSGLRCLPRQHSSGRIKAAKARLLIFPAQQKHCREWTRRRQHPRSCDTLARRLHRFWPSRCSTAPGSRSGRDIRTGA